MTSVGKDVEKLEPLYTAGGTAAMENNTAVPQKLGRELPYDLAIPFLGTYPKNWKQELEEVFVRPCSEQHYS